MQTLTITRPDDWHLHLRDGAALASTVSDVSVNFARGMVMPNLSPPIVNTAQAQVYREKILAARPPDSDWQPLMTLYLTDNTAAEEITRAQASGFIHGVKYYPAGATTNSDAGVSHIGKASKVLERMQEIGMPLQIHGEVTDPDIDIFDRETVFIDRILMRLVKRFPELKIIVEHITTSNAVEFVTNSDKNISATITPQHLLFNRNHLLAGGIRPHFYCLPVLKRSTHQQALIDAATSGDSRFFLGTDSAPHTRASKESACGCAGCYSHHAAIQLYAEVFARADALDKLEGFASHFGADFYNLPRNSSKITLRRQAWQLPQASRLGNEEMTPLYAGETLQWQAENDAD
ncbi:MAG: dihydroorotase [Gammaproteobacteria bacterium]|nr:MAG: dihydroorotase [Gammaproteobacteria bacterium]